MSQLKDGGVNVEFLGLQGVISQKVGLMPDKIAVEYGSKNISYSQLENQSNRIGEFLIENNCKNENIMIYMDRSPELVVSILGVIKSECVFVPFEPNYPENRQKIMIDIVKPTWAISTINYLEKLNSVAFLVDSIINVIIPGSDRNEIKNYSNLKLFFLDTRSISSHKFPENIINKHLYIYFTSGSTGQPKAILGRHRSLKHFIDWEIEEFDVNSNFRVSQLTSPAFDPFLRDVFVALCSGATLYIPEDQDILISADKLVKWIDDKSITLIHIVPSLFKNMTTAIKDEDNLQCLKYVFLAGEMLRGKDIELFIHMFKNRIQLINLYGPTETTLAKLFYRILEGDENRTRIPVGKTISYTEALILDKDLKSCQVECIGEIYIRTPFISSGYFNDKEMTKKVFIRNPFNNNPQDIIYKTGDLGMLNQDGNLEIVGRADHQVKIRGVRIELAEIENILLGHEYIKDAVVVASEDENGDKFLSAYFVEKSPVSTADIRDSLRNYLPEYMIPSYFVRMDELPLTYNGKLNRKTLPNPKEVGHKEFVYIAPQNETEEKLVDLWKQVLKIDVIGTEDNFFHIGGHSLRAASLASLVSKAMEIQFSLRDVFSNPTIKAMSVRINEFEKVVLCPIKVVEERELYPVSPAQKRIYILNRFEENTTNYNISFAMEIYGELDRLRFDEAIKKIIQRHEVFRTSFIMDNGQPFQKINKDINFKITYTEFSEEELEQEVKKFIRPFDLSVAPLIRVCLAKTGEQKYAVMFDMHHIISDGSSIGIIIKDFIALYECRTLPDLKIQYKDYAEWQNTYLCSELMRGQEEYWLGVLTGEIPVISMPVDHLRPTFQSFDGDSVSIQINKELTKRISALSQNEGATIYMTLIAAYYVLLSKYSGQEDIIIGSPVAGRKYSEIEKLPGMFVNTLVLRNKPEPNKAFRKFLQEVKANTLDAFENQDYQFEELVEKLNVQRDFSRNPLFDVMFVLQNFDKVNMGIDGLKIKEFKLNNKVSKFDMVLTASEEDEAINLELRYCTQLFNRSKMEQLLQHYVRILDVITNNADTEISRINMLSQDETNQILYDFNNTECTFPDHKTINELFEEQVENTPENIAVKFQNYSMTYRQLNEKSNKLARTLREKGVSSDSIVGIMCRRSLEMLIGIMGILKAGAAYLPIGPNYPVERINYMLKDSSANILLTQNEFIEKIIFDGCILDLDADETYSTESSNLSIVNEPENLAYVIYTSGSTGNPKGVMIEHRALLNRLHWMQKKYPIGEGDTILQKTPYTFDVSVWELLWWSLQGASVCMLVPDGEKNPEEIIDAIEKYRITIMHFVPSMLNSFLSYLESNGDYFRLNSLRQVFASGEALTLHQVDKFNALLHNKFGIKLNNLYGPTEAAIDVSYFDCSTGNKLDTIPIGKPIDNIKLYILDKNNSLQPIGVPGELYIAGTGLARGYLKRPELTSEKFISNPYNGGEKLYKTGDLAKWMPDGNIEYLGRIDHQVKIRGFRIELGEIEETLRKHEKVNETVVIVGEDKEKNKYLCAYIVSEKEFTVSEIKLFLSNELPEYMIPSYFVRLEKLPLSPNGKINRKALPEPQANIKTGIEYIAPRNEIEKKIAELWKDILNVDIVGMEDNFFDLGGNSIRLIDLYSRLEQIYPGRLKVTDLFTNTKVSELALFLSSDASIRKKIEFKTVQLPSEYFLTSDYLDDDCLMHLTVEKSVYEKISSISYENNIDVYHLLIAAYIYLLSEVSNQSNISVAAINEENSSILFIETDMNDINNLSELFNTVREKYQHEVKQGGYPIQQLDKEIFNKGDFETISLVYEGKISNVPQQLFDISLNIDERSGCLNLLWEYNAQRLVREKVEILINAYVKLIKIISENK